LQENELLSQILSDYTAENPAAANDIIVSTFCRYFSAWLVEHPVIGVGVTANGVALRLADGRELLLSAGAEPADTQPTASPFNITGNSGSGITRGTLGDTPSVSITKG
jgi:hypothetical protein